MSNLNAKTLTTPFDVRVKLARQYAGKRPPVGYAWATNCCVMTADDVAREITSPCFIGEPLGDEHYSVTELLNKGTVGIYRQVSA